MRFTSLFALVFSFIAFVLGLLTLFAGMPMSNSKAGLMTYAYINRWDHSTFSDTGTIAGASNWYSLHVLSICSGSGYSGSQNIVCFLTRNGRFDGQPPIKTDGKNPNFAITGLVLVAGLSAQIGAAGVAIIVLPFLVQGTRHWNGLLVPILSLGWFGAFVAAGAGSAYALSHSHTAYPKQAPVTYSPIWIGMLWVGLLCLLFAGALEHIERNFERFTEKGMMISRRNKPQGVPLWVWNPWLKRQRGGGGGEYAEEEYE